MWAQQQQRYSWLYFLEIVPPDPLVGRGRSRHVAFAVESRLGCAVARDVLRYHYVSQHEAYRVPELLSDKILVAYRALVRPVLGMRPFVAIKMFTVEEKSAQCQGRIRERILFVKHLVTELALLFHHRGNAKKKSGDFYVVVQKRPL